MSSSRVLDAVRSRWPERGWLALAAALATWLTLLSWTPFHEKPGTYVVPLLGITLAVAATGLLLRGLRLPVVLVPLLQLILLGLWFNHAWAAGTSWRGWLPTRASLEEVGLVLAAAVDTAQTYVAPIEAEVTTFAPLMLVSGAVVAVLVDLLAVGLRRAPVAGLPLLAVYTAPVSILLTGVPWWTFVLAAAGFLLMVAAQEETRLSRWGRNVSGTGRLEDSQSTRVSPQAVWGSARRIGLTATGIAVLVPLAVPTVSLSLLDGPGRGGGGGGNPVTVDNPMVNMRRDLTRGTDVDMVRVRTDDPDVSYLRIAVLDSYSGEAWRPGKRESPPDQRADGPISPPPGLEPVGDEPTYPWDVEVLGEFDPDWLPAPYPTTSIVAAGDWRYDQDTLDFASFDDQDARAMTYSLERLTVEPDVEKMAFAPATPATVFAPNTELPEDLPGIVRQLAAEVTEGARTKYEKAVALQQWFRVDGGFEYSLRPSPGTGVNDLERFLRDEGDGRVGYCEQFAAAMALMGRTVGIPSRVVVGFLRPEREPGGAWVYSAHDMHAWPEMYFHDTGWVRFEPTPATQTGAVPAYTQQPIDRPDDDPSATASGSATAAPDRAGGPNLPEGGAGTTGTGPTSSPGLMAGLVGAVVGFVAILGPRTLRELRRRRRWDAADDAPGLAESAWSELRDVVLDLRLHWDDGETLRTRSRALVDVFGRPGSEEDSLGRASHRGPGSDPEAESALDRLVSLLEQARYSRSMPVGAAAVADVRADVDRVAEALSRGAGRRRTRRATWLPASLWRGRTSDRLRARTFAFGDAGVDRAV